MNRKLTIANHRLEYALLSDVGLVRSMNQDAVVAAVAGSEEVWQQRGHVFVVADGMGAHAAGELASKLAVDTLPLSYQKHRWRPPPDALRKAVHDANARIYARATANEEFRGMGTTLSALVLVPQGALVAHVGDSRVYRLRDGTLQQLTFDHSLVWEVCEAEGITEDEVPAYIPRNVITRSVGSRPEVEVDMEGPFPLQSGDTFLLCSDGLTARTRDQELGTILGCLAPGEAVQALVDLAITRGGQDNVSAIVVRYDQTEGTPQSTNPAPSSAKLPGAAYLWAGLSAAVFAAAGSLAWGPPAALAGGAVGALVAIVAAAIHRHAHATWPRRLDGRPLGRGPYTTCPCPPDQQAAQLFDATVRQLQEVAQAENWPIDWPRFNALADQARAAASSGDYCGAVRRSCQIITMVVDQTRTDRRETAG